VTDVRRSREELSPPESMRLLGGVSLGRVVFTERALPAIRPVSHLVDGDYIVIRTDSSAAIISGRWSGPGSVVAYEADTIGPADHLGWSVIVVGVARWVTDPEKAAAYRRALRPWVTGSEDQLIAIHADIVTGFRLVSTTSTVISTGQARATVLRAAGSTAGRRHATPAPSPPDDGGGQRGGRSRRPGIRRSPGPAGR
jgi:Pyridoxamine 5'-phosphate oxidase